MRLVIRVVLGLGDCADGGKGGGVEGGGGRLGEGGENKNYVMDGKEEYDVISTV